MTLKHVNIAAIGCGYWGPNLIRNCVEIPHVSLEAVADLDWDRLDHIRMRYPGIPLITDNYAQIFNAGIDAVIVSTPPETHYDIVSDCLRHGLHVLVEKPLATTTGHARELIDLAARHDRILMVGHTFEYNPAVRALDQAVHNGELGRIHYIDAVRVGLGLFHPSLNVIWDLAPHDVSILIHILRESPHSVSASGLACVQDAVEDVAYLTLDFPSGVLAHIRLSWLDPSKTRRITVVGDKKMIVYDDVEAHEKLKVYDKRVDTIRRTDTFGDFQFAYHYGSIVSPYVRFEEPLRLECLHFAESILNGTPPLTDGWNGLRVVEVIEAAQRSLAERRPVPVDRTLSAGAPTPHVAGRPNQAAAT